MVVVQLLKEKDKVLSETVCEDIILSGQQAVIVHGGNTETIPLDHYERDLSKAVPVYMLYIRQPEAKAEAEETEAEEVKSESESAQSE